MHCYVCHSPDCPWMVYQDHLRKGRAELRRRYLCTNHASQALVAGYDTHKVEVEV